MRKCLANLKKVQNVLSFQYFYFLNSQSIFKLSSSMAAFSLLKNAQKKEGFPIQYDEKKKKKSQCELRRKQ